MRKTTCKVTTFCCDFLFAFSLSLGWGNSKIFAGRDLVYLAIVIIFAV